MPVKLPYFYTVIDLSNYPVGPAAVLPHITITPPVTELADVPIDTAVEALKGVTQSFAPFTISFGERGLFGPFHDIPVRRVTDKWDMLHALHASAVAALEAAQYPLDHTYANERYNPHTTLIDSLPEPTGEFYVDHIAIIRNTPRDGRQVYAILPFDKK